MLKRKTFFSYLSVTMLLLSLLLSGCSKPAEPAEVTAIYAGTNHTIGLKADGTVAALGLVSKKYNFLSDWTNIVHVSASDNHVVGVKADGTVVAAGVNNFGQCNVSSYSDVTAVAAGSLCSILLHADGSITALGNYNSSADLSGTDFVSIHACHQNDLALRSDGTFKNLCFSSHVPDESEWKDLIFITGGNTHTIGIQPDGTILVKGANTYGECDIPNWKYVGPRP